MLAELIFTLLVFAVLPITIVLITACVCDIRLDKIYNDGVCKKCKGEQYISVHSGGFYVVCENCGGK